MPDRSVDVLIAGQGAAAFAAALYAARYRLDTLVAGPEFGGETAIGGLIENYPGWPEIDGYDLMLKFKEQAERYEVPIVNEAVTAVERDDDCFLATLSDNSTVRAGALILAVGRERRRLNLPHENEWLGKGVSLCSTCDAPLYRDKRVIVVGGGNAAVEGALLLDKHAKEVTLAYRRDSFFRPEPILLKLLEHSTVRIAFETEIMELLGDDQAGLTGARLSRPIGGQNTLDVDGVFVEIGADPRTGLATALGVALNDETGEIHVDKMMRTNVPGVSGAGDVTDGSGTLKQTITAAAQGALAALAAYQHVHEHGGHCAEHEQAFSLD